MSIPKALPLFDCFAAPCVEACPVNQKVPAYIAAEGEGRRDQALAIVLADNPLAHVTGILCDHVCQEHCSRLDYEGSVRIRDVKRSAAQGDRLAVRPLPLPGGSAKGKVAVVGAGPAGLACAYHLALAGQEVKVFDKSPAPGGVPANVIPKFRIEREEIDADVGRIRALGVAFEFGAPVPSLEVLRAQGFESVFLGIGAEAAKDAAIQGEGVERIDALAFLERCSAQGPESFSGVRNVVVMGGGNTACDAVRAASRIPGIGNVHLSYRRTKREMPADKEELGNALGEGGILLELSLPESMEPGLLRLRKMSLGLRDSSGRRKPLPTEECFDLPCDLLVSAVGEEPDARLLKAFGLEVDEKGLPWADPETLQTKVEGLYIGGDALRGPRSIISAEADGRRAARAILARLGISYPLSDYEAPPLDKEKLALRGEILPSLDSQDPEFAAREAQRCLACDSACLRCVEVCPNRANLFVEMGRPFSQSAQILHLDRLCNECGNCGFFCPYQGEPYAGKPTLFDDPEDLDRSKNAGFAFTFEDKLPGLYLRPQVGGRAFHLDHSAWNGASSQPELAAMAALAREVYRSHAYLVEVPQ